MSRLLLHTAVGAPAAVRRRSAIGRGPGADLFVNDPLVAPLEALGEPIFKIDSNPTVERISKLIFDMSRDQGMPVVAVRVWETPTSFAEYRG